MQTANSNACRVSSLTKGMNTVGLKVQYRPIRVGLCIPTGDFEAFQQAIQLTTTLWGGRFNPIIPVGGCFSPGSIEAAFSADILIPVGESLDLDAYIGSDQYRSHGSWIGRIYVAWEEERLSTLLTVAPCISRLYDDHIRGNRNPDISVIMPTWKADDPLRNVWLSTFGDYPQPELVGTDYRALLAEVLLGRQFEIREQLPPKWNKGFVSPLDITAEYCEEDFEFPRYSSEVHGTFTGSASSFDDLVCFWNLLAAGFAVSFFDPDHSEECRPLIDNDLARLKEAFGPSFRPMNWHRRAVVATDLGSAFSPGSVHNDIVISFDGRFLPKPFSHCFEERSAMAVIEEGSKRQLKFQLPEKPWRSETDPHQRLAVRIRSFSFGQDLRFIPPNVPDLWRCFQSLHIGISSVRCEPDSVSVIVTTSDTDVTLSELSADSLVRGLFDLAGIEASMSKSGRVVTRLISHMGGVQGCRVFKIKGARKLIAAYGPDQPFSYAAGIPFLTKNWKPEYEEFSIGPGAEPRSSPHNVFGYLVDQDVFRLGKRILCPSCQLDAWFSIDDLAVRVTCPYCGDLIRTANQIGRDKLDYRRSGLFGRGDNQEGGIPVSLVLQQLDSAMPESILLALPAFDLTFSDGRKCETDLVVIMRNLQGTVDLLVGECKSEGGKIDQNDVANMTAIAESFRGTVVRVFMLFAKAGSFSRDEVQIALSANTDGRSRVILLSENELEPFELYDRTTPKLQRPRSLIEMAANSKRIYAPRPAKGKVGAIHATTDPEK